MNIEVLIEEASKLSHAERAELLDVLILLQGSESNDIALTPVQQDDLNRRIEEYEAGMVPGDEAFARLRNRKKCARMH